MNINEDYTNGKVKTALWEAIELLATEEGNLKSRLEQVFIGGPLYMIEINHFSDKLKPKWKIIETQITKYPETYDYNGKLVLGSIEATFAKIQNKTASKIAIKIVKLYEEVSKFTIENQ
jgi:hypothetical protein